MATNIEIKVKLDSFTRVEVRIRGMQSASAPARLQQCDSFFAIPAGRLKVREQRGEVPELILYFRANTVVAKASRYFRIKTRFAPLAKQVLASLLGCPTIVRKSRTLYTVGPTRIHLDEVEGLGRFLEFEVVLGPKCSITEGRHVADRLIKHLRIPRNSLLAVSYCDLVRGNAPT